MIETSDNNILYDLPENSVIVLACNAKGWYGSGINKRIHDKWPQAFKAYYELCSWFKNGHEDELLGYFARTQINPSLIVCEAIVLNSNKHSTTVDLDAWYKICLKIFHQTKRVNKHYNKNWTIHLQEKNGCGKNNDDWEALKLIFNDVFGQDSNVKLVIHS